MQEIEWSSKHSATTLLSILGLNWLQERHPQELKRLGDMKQLHERIMLQVNNNQIRKDKIREKAIKEVERIMETEEEKQQRQPNRDKEEAEEMINAIWMSWMMLQSTARP